MPYKDPSKIQAIIFKNDRFTSKQARDYLKKHKLKPIKRVHKTDNFLRYRLRDPADFKRFRTIKRDGFDLIIGFN